MSSLSILDPIRSGGYLFRLKSCFGVAIKPCPAPPPARRREPTFSDLIKYLIDSLVIERSNREPLASYLEDRVKRRRFRTFSLNWREQSLAAFNPR
ncbi:hypothetical protein EVAR_47665_1 [Eumeta japonica]|uniref:Uncharacterized protein n=1 Tax=Eumeta variegata TaxID=151549 RepID=A0A4C1Y299_EUMVA|nr:hypothetical protein EVAR_47665_1 [Eumeta japonica]